MDHKRFAANIPVKLALLTLIALACTGGTFTCESKQDNSKPAARVAR